MCGGKTERQFPAPMVMRAAYPDGHKRNDGYQEVKEMAKLRLEEHKISDKKRQADTIARIKKEMKNAYGAALKKSEAKGHDHIVTEKIPSSIKESE